MPFRRVIDAEAGPLALGILAPPAARTLLIVRPRELPWDLVLTTTSGEADFMPLPRHEAALQAQRLYRTLEAGDVQIRSYGTGDGTRLALAVGAYHLLVCERIPGRPYRPAAFTDSATEQVAIARLLTILVPGEHDQEVYFNTAHFQGEQDP